MNKSRLRLLAQGTCKKDLRRALQRYPLAAQSGLVYFSFTEYGLWKRWKFYYVRPVPPPLKLLTQTNEEKPSA